MLDKTDDIAVAAEHWLAEFEAALSESDDGALRDLFHPDSYWRDAVALSWTLQTINGRDAILETLKAQAAKEKPSGFVIAPGRAAAAQGDAGRNGLHRDDLRFRDPDRPRRRHPPPDPRCRRRQPPEGVDAC